MLQKKMYDVILVGAGMAGSIVATKIAKEGVNPANGEKLKVALIEGGHYYPGKPKYGYGIPSRRQSWTHIVQDMMQGDRSRRFVDGIGYTGVGGASLHWGAKGNPPEDKDYEFWARETGVDWTKENLAEAVQETLRMYNSHTIPDKILQEYHHQFRNAAQSMGYKCEKILVHKKNCIGCGGHVETSSLCRYDAKTSTLLTYIPIAVEHGVEILPDTVVQQVILEKRGADWVATGVWYSENGAPAQKAEAKKIILGANWGNAPLLYASGYGPKDLLGDKLVVENPNVGANVDGHGMSYLQIVARFEDLVVHEPGDGNFGFYFLDDADSLGNDRLFVFSGADTSDSRGMFSGAQSYALSAVAPEFGHKHKDFMRNNWKEWRHIAGNPFYLGPMVAYSHMSAPRGRIRPDGSLQFDNRHPTILKRQKEVGDLLYALFEKMGAKEIRDDPRIEALRKGGLGGPSGSGGLGHRTGSVRAGVDRKNSVVNSNFECHDIQNLLMVDSETHPRSTSLWSGGIVASCVGTFAAQRIIANHFKRSQISQG